MSAVLLAVDANEGIKPQTVEHLEIARLIGVRRGVLALTKSDLATPPRSRRAPPRSPPPPPAPGSRRRR